MAWILLHRDRTTFDHESPLAPGNGRHSVKKLLLATAAISMMTIPEAFAGDILIVNGSAASSEPGTTTSITTQLSNFQVAAGNTITVVDNVPGSLAGYSQVWDIRFSNSSPLTSGVLSQYLSFMQGGGGIFVMGENSFFTTRNNSVLQLIADATGETLSFVSPNDHQQVIAPFTGPNSIADGFVDYSGSGGISSPGAAGQFITTDGSIGGTGVAWGVGDLVNAPAGALTAIFDVNFMQTGAEADSQTLLRNLISFVQTETTATPEPASMMMIGVALAGLAAARRRRNTKAA